jgi:hypothetical protein
MDEVPAKTCPVGFAARKVRDENGFGLRRNFCSDVINRRDKSFDLNVAKYWFEIELTQGRYGGGKRTRWRNHFVTGFQPSH